MLICIAAIISSRDFPVLINARNRPYCCAIFWSKLFCYLSHPSITTYWKLETSNVEFSGDRIGVYFSFIYGSFQDHACLYFTLLFSSLTLNLSMKFFYLFSLNYNRLFNYFSFPLLKKIFLYVNLF